MENEIEEFLFYLKNSKHCSDNTIEAYRHDICKMSSYVKEHGVDDYNKVRFTDLNAYVLAMEKNGISSASVSRNISSIKSFFLFLLRNRQIMNDPSANLKSPKISKSIPDILTIEEINFLLDAPNIKTAKGIRDKAILELLYATGIKVTELICLEISDVNLNMNTLICRSDNKERVIPFGNHAKDALKSYLSDGRSTFLKSDTEILFVNCQGKPMTRQGLWKIIKEYGEETGLEYKLTPHIFRHTFAVHMIENGADLKSLQDMLGHADISTTQIYTSFINNRLGNVYKKSHPRK